MTVKTTPDLSVRDVADSLGCSEATVRRHIKTGAIQAYKMPHNPQSRASVQRAEWRIPADEVERIKRSTAAGEAFDRKRYLRAASAA